MIYFLGAVFLFLAFFLIALILLQEGKGGGLAAMGGAMTDSVMGARNPLRRLTAYFFIAFVVISIGINMLINREASPEFGVGQPLPTADSDAEPGKVNVADTPADAATADGKSEGSEAISEEGKTAPAKEAASTGGENKAESAPAADAKPAE